MQRRLPLRRPGKLAQLLLAALLTAPALALGQVAGPATGQGLQQLNLATFDAAWNLINERYWDPEFGGLDWQGVRDELRPRAAVAADRGELREVLSDMISRLGQSHFGVIPGSSVDGLEGGRGASSEEAEEAEGSEETADSNSASGPDSDRNRGAVAAAEEEAAADGASDGASDEEESLSAPCSRELEERLLAVAEGERAYEEAGPGFDVALLDDRLLVSRVEPEGPAAEAGIRAGWQVVRIDDQLLGRVGPCLGAGLDQRAKRYLVYKIVQQLLAGGLGSRVEIELADEEGDRHSKDLRRSIASDAETVRFGNLPPMQFRFHRRWIEPPGSDARIGLIRFNVWMMPVAQAFERAIVEMQDADGMILDLRGNPGGVAGLSAGIAGYFVDDRDSLGTLKYRRDELHLRINPRLVTFDGQPFVPYRGPLAILIDQFSASTSEIFTAGLQDLGRARVFGETSAAAALPAVIERLPNGDYLMHALADLLRPNGGRVEGVGVVPDEETQSTRQGLLAGEDEVLDRAVAWLVQTDSASDA